MLKVMDYETLAHFLSAERLATYLRIGGGDKHKAAELYIENLNQCRILYGKLHWLAIGLRNAINRQLSQKYGSAWFDNPLMGLGEKEQTQIQKAKEHLTRDKKSLTNG